MAIKHDVAGSIPPGFIKEIFLWKQDFNDVLDLRAKVEFKIKDPPCSIIPYSYINSAS